MATVALMAEVTIKARANGPYKVEGPVTVIDADGNEFALPEGSSIVLCRCGHSRTKPFCDSSHKRVGFVADDCARRVGTAEGEASTGGPDQPPGRT